MEDAETGARAWFDRPETLEESRSLCETYSAAYRGVFRFRAEKV